MILKRCFVVQGGGPGEDACDRKDLGAKQRAVAGGACQGQPAGQGQAGREPAAPAGTGGGGGVDD